VHPVTRRARADCKGMRPKKGTALKVRHFFDTFSANEKNAKTNPLYEKVIK